MIWRNNAERYGAIAAGFHWLIAILVIAMLGLGLYMVRLDPSPLLFKLYFWHKSIGITILALAGLRLLWKLINIQPLPISSQKLWEKKLARLIHLLLYVSLFALPFSGWVMSSAKGISVSVFGWFTMPDFVSENRVLASRAEEFHEIAAYSLLLFILLHIAGALKHYLIDRDGTLARMSLPLSRPTFAVLFLLALAGIPAAISYKPPQLLASQQPSETSLQVLAPAKDGSNEVQALPKWIIDKEESRITFEATQMGAPFTGSFAEFSGDISFDPGRLDQSRVEVAVVTASVSTGSADRDDYLPLPVWLAVESFPESIFFADNFVKTGEYQYLAHGTLTIKGIVLPLEVPFTLEIMPTENGLRAARMEVSFIVNRLDFNVGEGDWQDVSMVGNPVTVRVLLVAREAEPE